MIVFNSVTIISYELFFNIVTTISYTFPSTNKQDEQCLLVSLVKMCISRSDPLLAYSCSDGVIAEMHQSLPPCTNIHCLVTINVQQVLMNVNGCHFFHTEEFNDTLFLHAHSHVRHHFVRLPLCCHLSHSNNM